MNRHITIVESLKKKLILNSAYQPSVLEIEAVHKVMALAGRLILNKPKTAVRTGRRVYRRLP